MVACVAGATVPAWAQGTTTPGQAPDFGWKDGITLAIAVLGAALGLLNTWTSISAKRLRVKIRPESVQIAGDHERSILIDVVNLSAFHVTVAEIGFLIGPQGRRYPIRTGQHRQGGELPTRLDPRESVAVHVYPYRSLVIGADIRKAYAKLASGEIITGSSPALKELAAEIAKG